MKHEGSRNAHIFNARILDIFKYFQMLIKASLRGKFGNSPPKQLGARIANNPANLRPITYDNEGWCHRCRRQMRQIIRHFLVKIMSAKRIDQRFFGAVIALADIIFKSFAPWAMARGDHNKLATAIGGFCRPDAAADNKYCQQ